MRMKKNYNEYRYEINNNQTTKENPFLLKKDQKNPFPLFFFQNYIIFPVNPRIFVTR